MIEILNVKELESIKRGIVHTMCDVNPDFLTFDQLENYNCWDVVYSPKSLQTKLEVVYENIHETGILYSVMNEDGFEESFPFSFCFTDSARYVLRIDDYQVEEIESVKHSKIALKYLYQNFEKNMVKNYFIELEVSRSIGSLMFTQDNYSATVYRV